MSLLRQPLHEHLCQPYHPDPCIKLLESFQPHVLHLLLRRRSLLTKVDVATMSIPGLGQIPSQVNMQQSICEIL